MGLIFLSCGDQPRTKHKPSIAAMTARELRARKLPAFCKNRTAEQAVADRRAESFHFFYSSAFPFSPASGLFAFWQRLQHTQPYRRCPDESVCHWRTIPRFTSARSLLAASRLVILAMSARSFVVQGFGQCGAEKARTSRSRPTGGAVRVGVFI